MDSGIMAKREENESRKKQKQRGNLFHGSFTASPRDDERKAIKPLGAGSRDTANSIATRRNERVPEK